MSRIVFKLLVSTSCDKLHAKAVNHSEEEDFFGPAETAEPHRSFGDCQEGQIWTEVDKRPRQTQLYTQCRAQRVWQEATLKHTLHRRCQPVYGRHMPEQQKHARSYCDTWADCSYDKVRRIFFLLAQSRLGHSECGMCFYTSLDTWM